MTILMDNMTSLMFIEIFDNGHFVSIGHMTNFKYVI